MNVMEIYYIVFFIALGLIIGSFLSVCVYRIPNELSICKPARSFCPKCNMQLRWFHNIPLLSWIALRGKCANCQEKISFKYPLVELTTAIFAYLSYTHYGFTATALIIFIFCCSIIVSSYIDMDHMIIPNVITLPGTAIAIVLVAINAYTNIFAPPVVADFKMAFWGFMSGAGFLWIIGTLYLVLAKKDGLGMGDIKQLAYTGILFGPECALYTIFVGSMIGTVAVFARFLISRHSLKQHFPFGPYLSLGTATYLFFGDQIINRYFGLLN